MTVRLVCPKEQKAFTLPQRTWEELEGRTIRCPLCREVHEAVRAEPRGLTPPDEALEAEIVTEAPSEKPLYKVAAVGLATFLGSLVGGGIVMAVNFQRLGRKGPALHALLWSLLGTVATVLLAWRLPDEIPGMVLWVPGLLLMIWLAHTFFSEALARQEAAGVEPAGTGSAALIGLACLAVLAAVVFGYVFLLWSPFPGTRLDIGADEVYYSGSATEADARRLAQVLTDEDFLDDGTPKTVHVTREGARYAVDFVLVDGAWNRSDVADIFRELGAKIAEAGFGRPLDLRMNDDMGELHKTITVE